MIAYLRDLPGMDAAVYAPGLDLRWRNDLPGPLMITADASAGNTLTVALWGVNDGRSTSVAKPKILKHAFATDQANPQADGQATVYLQPATDVVTGRVVRDAAGEVIRNERIVTHYQALEKS